MKAKRTWPPCSEAGDGRMNRYGGVLVSNADIGIGTYKPASLPVAFPANNHGSVERTGGDYYIFYHRHTNGTWYSRQGCAERLTMRADGGFDQVGITSQGADGKPVPAEGEIPAYLACVLFTENRPGKFGDGCERITQDGHDGDEEDAYIAAVGNGTVMGFKYCIKERRLNVEAENAVTV